MKKRLIIGLLSIGFLQSCNNKEPSGVKIFVRNAENKLVNGARVVIVADIPANESSIEHVDTVLTNESGFAVFSLKSKWSGNWQVDSSFISSAATF